MVQSYDQRMIKIVGHHFLVADDSILINVSVLIQGLGIFAALLDVDVTVD